MQRGGSNIAVPKRSPILTAVEWLLLLLVFITIGVLGVLWLRESGNRHGNSPSIADTDGTAPGGEAYSPPRTGTCR